MTRRYVRRRLAGGVMLAGLLAIATIASAQRIMVAPGRVMRVPPKWAKAEDFDGAFIVIDYASVEMGDHPGVDRVA